DEGGERERRKECDGEKRAGKRRLRTEETLAGEWHSPDPDDGAEEGPDHRPDEHHEGMAGLRSKEERCAAELILRIAREHPQKGGGAAHGPNGEADPGGGNRGEKTNGDGEARENPAGAPPRPKPKRKENRGGLWPEPSGYPERGEGRIEPAGIVRTIERSPCQIADSERGNREEEPDLVGDAGEPEDGVQDQNRGPQNPGRVTEHIARQVISQNQCGGRRDQARGHQHLFGPHDP